MFFTQFDVGVGKPTSTTSSLFVSFVPTVDGWEGGPRVTQTSRDFNQDRREGDKS